MWSDISKVKRAFYNPDYRDLQNEKRILNYQI